MSDTEAEKSKKAKPKNGQAKSGEKRATKDQPTDSEEEHGEPKFEDSDSDLHTSLGDCPDNSDASICIFWKGLFSVDTRGRVNMGAMFSVTNVGTLRMCGGRKGCMYVRLLQTKFKGSILTIVDYFY